jgi:hypothetical protein
VVILSLESVALGGLALSWFLIGSLAGWFMDEIFSPGEHRITLTMFALGGLCLLGCAVAITAAIAVGAERGFRGTVHAAFWRTSIGLATVVQVGWVWTVATGSVEQGIADRIGWCVALGVGVAATVGCAMAWRDRANPIAIPPPPLPV